MSVPSVEPPHMRFDRTVNLGQVLTLIAMIIAGLAAWFNMKSDLRAQDDRIKILESGYASTREQVRISMDVLSAIKTDLAVIRDRMERSTNNALQGSQPK